MSDRLAEPHPLPQGCDPQAIRVWATRHAVERLGWHHERASWKMVVAMWCRGQRIEAATAMNLVGRPWEADNPSLYVLTPDRRGMLVGVYDPGDSQHTERVVVVTYLRFQDQQRRFALEHWPPTHARVERTDGPGAQ